jgi:hypothetical protein
MDDTMLAAASFAADASLKCDIGLVGKCLDGLRGLRRLKGRALKYGITRAGQKDGQESTLELTEMRICLVFLAKKADKAAYAANLTIFLSLMPVLKEFYTIEFSSVYSYMIEALEGWHSTVKESPEMLAALRERINALNDSNCALAHQLARLSRLNGRLAGELSFYMRFSRMVVGAAKSDGRSGKEGRHALLGELGIDAESAMAVERRLDLDRG